MSYRRPPGPDEREAIATALETLAARIRTAAPTMRVLGTALDIGYPTRASTSPAEPTNRTDDDGTPIPGDSRPEALALQPDHAFAQARTLLADLRRLGHTAAALNQALAAWDPDRRVELCPRCRNPLLPGLSRCQRMTKHGTRCGVCREPDCPRDGQPLVAGEKMRDGRCGTCAKRHERAAKAAAPPERIARVDRLHLADNVIIAEVDQ